MRLDRSELLLKATAVNFLNYAIAHLNASLRHATAFERSTTKEDQTIHAHHAAHHQFEALMADEAARACGIESNEMMKFMHLFFATNIEDMVP